MPTGAESVINEAKEKHANFVEELREADRTGPREPPAAEAIALAARAMSFVAEERHVEALVALE